MRLSKLIVIYLLVAAVFVDAQGTQSELTFRSGVNMVFLPVVVTNAHGHYVADLSQDDFLVVEEDSLQDITIFSRSELPIALVLLIDTSASMSSRTVNGLSKIDIAKQTATEFVSHLMPNDIVQVIAFSDDVNIVQDFTSDKNILRRAIATLQSQGETALYGAVYTALQELERTKPKIASELRRSAIVLLSDGEDTRSRITFDDVLDAARHRGTVVYTIGIKNPEVKYSGTYSKKFEKVSSDLKRLAHETGGAPFFPDHLKDLGGVYRQIADELANQFLIGYLSKNFREDGGWRRTFIQILGHNELQVRTKTGYFAPGTP